MAILLKNIYNPILYKDEQIILPQICKNKSAIIGEISKPPIEGINFLNGNRKVSDAIAINLKNGFCQSILGNHDKKHLIITTNIYN